MAVRDWFPDWLEEHRTRFAWLSLPDPQTEAGKTQYSGWVAAFVHRGLHDRSVATAASELLMAEEHYPSQHLPRLCELAVKIYQQRQPAEVVTGAQPLEVARQQSRECLRCDGQGLALVKHRTGGDPDRKIPAITTAYCVCALGCSIERLHKADAPEVWGRMPHLANVLAGRSQWVEHTSQVALSEAGGVA